ncbi:hypothetical protein CEP52_014770 [Fusarium oligoseptatum]|uniref:F-box domain-containing protein n=1 Tax=Fusarium oligoseptatum TaxID=2604345 RepID=A0A428SJ57_9HYPO|nr:hypothetical protein CEP52_014770 [Fusarium oligoseptatum]
MPPRSSKRPQRRKRKTRMRLLCNRPPALLNLPVEVMILVIEHLPDFKTLSSVVETCRAMYNIFCRHSKLVVRRILAEACGRVRDSLNPYDGVCRITEELEFAVRRQFLPRAHVEDAFAVAWSLFSEMKVEEILYPIARQLAWTYLGGRPQEAIKFLEAVRFHREPFTLPLSRRSSPALLPVARSLHYLFDYINDDFRRELVADDIIDLIDLQSRHTTFLWITSASDRNKHYMFTLFFPPQPPFTLRS